MFLEFKNKTSLRSLCLSLRRHARWPKRMSRPQFVSIIHGFTDEGVKKFSFGFKLKIEINYSPNEMFHRRLNRGDFVSAQISRSLRLEGKGEVLKFRE